MSTRIQRRLLLLPLAWLAACQAPGPAARPAAAVAADPTALQQATPAPPGTLDTTLQLIRHRWQLVAAVDAGGHRIDALFVRPEAPLRLDFNASLVSIGNACRVMSAHQQVEPGRLQVAPFDIAPQACPHPALAGLEAETARRLQGTLQLRLEAGAPARLVLTNAAGDVLTFAGQ